MNMFQMIVIFTLESKIGFINLGFGTYYDHCAMSFFHNFSGVPNEVIKPETAKTYYYRTHAL